MNRSRTILSALAVTLALVAAGCGSSSEGGSGYGDRGSSSGVATTTAADPGGSGGSDAPVALQGTVNGGDAKDISADGDAADVEVEMTDNAFSPTYIKAAPGATVTVALSNQGDNPHTFTLDDGSVDQTVSPGTSATVEITVPDSGSLRFSCDFHGAMGMQGAFYTGAGGSDPGAATTTTAATSSPKGDGY